MALRLGERTHVSKSLLATTGAVGFPFTWSMQIEVVNAIGQKITNASPLAIEGTIFTEGLVVIGEFALWALLCWITGEGAYHLGRRIYRGIKDRRTGPDKP